MNRLPDLCIAPNACLRDAMQALERGMAGIVLITDANHRLIGTLTDGDIRRALLGGATLGTPVESFVIHQFKSVRPQVPRAEILDLMRASQVQQIPIVTEDGRLCGLHLLREIVGNAERPNWGVIMAGGQGMRLRPLTDIVPKPMIPVAGRPILERIVLHMVGFGIRRIYLAINHLGHVVERHFGDGEAFGCEIHYLRETEPLGTGGALGLLPEPPTEPLLVMNGDLVTQADLSALLAFHAAHGFAVTMGVQPYVHTVPFGCVELEGPRVVLMEEKPQLTRLINTGIYALNPEVLSYLTPGAPATVPGLIAKTMAGGGTVGAFEIRDEWLDVGQWEQLKSARQGGT
ncbi:MAG: NTP transferase domain-containing protein [Candidatus Sericytochromatia bacterium]|nr:NTP transferase domain-containing protein [Candidatus Sericytochromatia bacterium]